MPQRFGGVDVLEPRVLLAAQLVRDINPTTESSGPGGFVELGGCVYFAATDGAHGRELWRSDGTPQGTWLVKDVVPGPGRSDPSYLTRTADRLFFATPYVDSGHQVWMSDGTAGGTVPVSGPGGVPFDVMGPLVPFNGSVYFHALVQPGPGMGLWKTDGTDAGTSMLCGYSTGGPESPGEMAVHRGALYFSAETPAGGRELYKTDGTPGGTVLVKDVVPGAAGSNPGAFAPFGDDLYFRATTPGAGTELWKTDGTDGGTVMVKDLRPGPDSSYPGAMAEAGGALFFVADDGAHGRELWKTDGTAAGTVMVTNTPPDASGDGPTRVQPLGSFVFFDGYDPAAGRELWRSDGTPAGTYRVKDLFPGPLSGSWASAAPAPGGRMIFEAGGGLWATDGTEAGTSKLSSGVINMNFGPSLGGTTLFAAQSDERAGELWATDGTPNGTRLLVDINSAGEGSSPHGFVPFRSDLVAVATDLALGTTFWKTDGTGPGTVPLIPGQRSAFGAEPTGLTAAGDRIFYYVRRSPPSGGYALAVTDGTPAGTALLRNVTAPRPLVASGGRVYFHDSGPLPADMSLWTSDGTVAGTKPLAKLPYNYLSYGRDVVANVNGTVYFTAEHPTAGVELFKTDGTVEGTHVLDVAPGSAGLSPLDLVNVNGTLFFSTFTDNQVRLWKSDGTVAGTVVVKEFGAPTGELLYLHEMTAAANWLYFRTGEKWSADKALWRSDGTTAGTVRLADLRVEPQNPPTAEPPEPHFNLTAVGGRLYFTNYDEAAGTELWSSDGTVASTRRVADLRPGPAGSNPADLTTEPAAGLLFFTADDGAIGREVWVTGPGRVPQVVGEVVPGPASSGPGELTAFGGSLYFTADDGQVGRELYKAGLGPFAEVVGQRLFYNRSRYDGRNPAANALDDAAVATDKAALLPGGIVSFANVSTYSRGINGIMVDVRGLAGDLGPDDFAFRAGRAGVEAGWVAAPAPLSITRRPGAGANGSDRVTIIWRDGAIRNRWLEVTVKPTADTNLSAPHVFLFGSLVGETGTTSVGANWTVDGADLSRVRAAARRAATSTTDALDFDRDGVIGPRDVSIARSSVGHSLLAAPFAAAARSAAAAGPRQAAMAPRSSPPPRARRTSYDILGA